MVNEIPTRTRGGGHYLRLALAIVIAAGAGALILTAPVFSAADNSPVNAAAWNATTAYAAANQYVTYRAVVDGQTKEGVFVNAWWTQGDAPSFIDNDGPWKLVGHARVVGADGSMSVDLAPAWNATTAYTGGTIVSATAQSQLRCFKAKYWNRSADPTQTVEHDWQTPWETLASCPSALAPNPPTVPPTQPEPPTDPVIPAPDVAAAPSIDVMIDKLPPQPAEEAVTLPIGTPVVPPVIPGPPPSATPAPSGDVGSALPADGYAFLRQVTDADWDWMFPMRSGRLVADGGARNATPFAKADGSTDTFTLPAFRRAVLEYNRWAKGNGYKQFLNEGTVKQQAQEFLVFWAKASRETSGSWEGAPSPWIQPYQDRAGVRTQVWKGGLYWVEEVGYASNADGTSPALGYIDAGSTDFPPVKGRSYHGRGIIQLSWNYNYGAFSYWLHDNGLMRDVIPARDTLLQRPDLVASNGALSILSGVWFWMTPQGQKPSSHDVLYGDVTHVSTSGTDPGLPQLRTGMTIAGKTTGPVAPGDTSDEGVMAFRIGTIINIVNGGLECNGAASWHNGPPQRVSYYNAYTTYFNERIASLSATRVSKATNLWTAKISDSSDETVKSATCFNQKSYYGW